MMLAPHPRSAAADLARVLACWLAVIVFLLGIGAAQALGRGPLHRHVESLATAQHHYHGETERHHHDAQDLSVLEVANAQDDAVDASAFALAVALALMALALASAWRDTRRHVWRPAPTWAWRTHISSALHKPPRQG